MTTGAQLLMEELGMLNIPNVSIVTDSNNVTYAVIPEYTVEAGIFAGQTISLAIPAPNDYPRAFGASIHVKPHLYNYGSIANVRNVTTSHLGGDWQYWSIRFASKPGVNVNHTHELLSQINGVFRKCQP